MWVAIKVTNLFDLEHPPLVVLHLRITGIYLSPAFPEVVSVRIVDGVDENGYLFPLRKLEKGQSTIYAVQVVCEPTAGWKKVSPAEGFLTPITLTAEIDAREDTRWIGEKSFTLPATAPSLGGFPVPPGEP